MKHADLSNHKRLDVLNKLDLLKADEAGSFDRLTRIVTRLLDAPVSLVTMVEENFQWFLGCTGLNDPYASGRKTPLSHSFCQHVVATKSPLVITDAREHPLVRDNLAIRDLNVIAYLGIPLVTTEGVALGSFCVIDTKPRVWTQEDIDLMTELSASVMAEIELRNELKKRHKAEEVLTEFIREQEQLRIAKEMTLALSHDLRTPLSSISLKIDMLAERVSDTELNEGFVSIKAKLEKIVSTLNDFHMMWSTTDIPTRPRQHADLTDTIRDALAFVKDSELFDTDSMMVETKNLDQPIFMEINPPLLKIAFSNILENAIIYQDTDDLEITLSVKRNSNEVCITIEDNGIGIPESDLPRIFEPLFKVSKARTASESASGLGLTVAKQIIEDHDGTINIKSEENIGTTVRACLPLPESSD